MEVDEPFSKRRRLEHESRPWWESPGAKDAAVMWSLCDALSLYANGGGGGAVAWMAAPGTPAESAEASNEPLLRALTQLANAAATENGVRRQLVSECQVHAPLLRLMQSPWAQQPLVAERCCRLLHWLCARAPENREVLASHSIFGGVRLLSFVDALLDVVEGHRQCREVLAHALRALAVLLPCPRVREELRRCQPRLLTCLAVALHEVLDVATVRAVCRWIPGLSGQVRQARSRLVTKLEDRSCCVEAEEVDDVHMADL
eukprot:TRINITY_DN95528_c0_g1_i1.p1 TRINITY_DN95528_c0_g1~~TRINITY_DN95528_c0_g1_i1.p1  ORF type:complete len:280 (-),score=42.97 TRINITY_DN95528_c0_g1_i1:7-786(-)